MKRLRDVLGSMPKTELRGFPEKITTYGKPDDNFTKIVETFQKDENGIVRVNRAVQFRQPTDFIGISLTEEAR